jgi:ring-1,2-phenylacetyl-CoA epoxidase subunit PaaD
LNLNSQISNPESGAVGTIWKLLGEVMDPEVPVLSVVDLGIIRNVEMNGSLPVVTITPTYSGCPAMDVIRMTIRLTLAEHGFQNAGKHKLKAFGIAPPNPKPIVCTPDLFQQEESIQCPHCNSYNTKMISQFGSTACKSLYQCNDCREPFDYFKCH